MTNFLFTNLVCLNISLYISVMKNTKHLNKLLGIKHISKPTDLPKLEDMAEVKYNDPQYPYESSYVKLPPKKKKVSKKPLKKRVFQKQSLIKRIFSWLTK